MAMIKCIECGNMISDKSEVCIHCGCPTKESVTGDNVICKINGKNIDFSADIDKIFKAISDDEKTKAIKIIRDLTELSLKSSWELCNIIIEKKEIPKEFSGTLEPQNASLPNTPKCPTCSSTNIRKIGAGERMASVIGFGLLSKKINKTWKCNNCGYTW